MYFLILLLSFFLNFGSQHTAYYYLRGVEHRNDGEGKKALNIWFEAKNKITDTKNIDPRIGFHFIEIVVEKEAEEYYKLATDFYNWGLSTTDFDRFGKYLEEEYLRVIPLLDSEKKEQWKKLNTKDKAGLLKEIRLFWMLKDPYPSNAVNERLIEHWKRIVYAKRKFTKSDNSPYLTDDRGTIYVKYGEPDRIKNKVITVSSVTNPYTGQVIYLSNNLSISAELWYYNFDTIKDYQIFTFGTPGEGGQYGLQPGIMSMVPITGNRIAAYEDDESTSFFSQSANQSNVTDPNNPTEDSQRVLFQGQKRVSRDGAELMLKYAILDQISGIDDYHNALFNDMTYDIISAMRSGIGEAFSRSALENLSRYDVQEKNYALQRTVESPDQLTDTIDEEQVIEINVKTFRFLNKSLEPEYLVAVDTKYRSEMITFHLVKNDNAAKLKRLDTFYLYDKNFKLVEFNPFILPLPTSDRTTTNTFTINNETFKSGLDLFFESQIIDADVDEKSKKVHSKINAEIIGSSGLSKIELAEPISFAENEQFIVSDLLFAFAEKKSTNGRIPVLPILDPNLSLNDSPIIYFEVYGLEEGKEYQVRLYYEKNEKDKVKKIKDTGFTLNFISNGQINKNQIEFNFENLKRGNSYNVVLEISDPLNPSNKNIRKSTFRINK